MPITKVLEPAVQARIFGDNWPIRRRWMKWSLVFFASNIEALIAWTIFQGGNAYGVQILMALLTAVVSILMFYIFGAVWDDHSKRRFLSFGGHPDPPTETDGQTDPEDK